MQSGYPLLVQSGNVVRRGWISPSSSSSCTDPLDDELSWFLADEARRA
jgi:hypothetical protein